nr:alpha/beta hydrolase fold domain-containing protein [Acidimicrobiia bacterium]
GQEIALRGRRHAPQAFGNPVVQCPAGEIALESCRPVGFVSVGPKGRLTGSATVVAVLRQASPEVDCRQGPGCVLVAGDLFDEDDVGIASLAFDPLAPVPRPPRIAVEPASDLRDGDLVSVSGRGFGGQEEVLQAICASGPVDFESCDFGTLSQVQPGPRGRFTATLDVSTVLDTESGPVDCGPEGACEIIAGDFFGGQGAVARAPLAFSAAPPRRYLDRVFEDVEVTRNVHYATAIGADGRPIDLKLDVYRPVGDTVERRPAVVWMHGGGFTFGSKGDMAAYARDSAERGYVGVTIQYRLSPATDGLAIDRAYRDGRAAVRWLRENAATYGIARRAIATGGYSAGAVTAINLAYAGSPSPEDRARVGAAVSLAGTRTIGVPERGEPPVLMFHGDRDTTVPYDQASASCAAILASGVRCRLITFPGAGHGLPYRRHLYAETARFLDRQLLQPEGIVASP